MFLTNDNKMLWHRLGWGALVTACLVALGIAWFDEPLFVMMRNLDCRLWGFFDAVFDGKVWIVASFIVLIVLCVKKQIKSKEFLKECKTNFNLKTCAGDLFAQVKTSHAFLIFCSVFSAGVIVKLLKIFIGRARPVFFEALDMVGFYPPSLDWAFNSMPSGHTTISFAGLVMIGMLAPKYKPLTWGLAVIIGVSRIAVGAHWPSDVLLGAFIGMLVADVIKYLLLRKAK